MRELDAGLLRLADEIGLGQLQPVADLDRHAVAGRRVDHPLDPLGRPERVVFLDEHVGQVGRVGVDIDRLVVEDLFDRPHEQFHESLLVGDIDFLGHPEPRPAAAMIDDRHGVGEDVIELGDGLFGEQRRPFAALGLHADEARLACQLLDVVVDALIVGDGEVHAAVGRDAVEDARLATVRQGFFQGEIALEMDVVVDEGKAALPQLCHLSIDLIAFDGVLHIGSSALKVLKSQALE